MEFPKQEYWSGLPFPPPADLPHPGIKPEFLASPALAGRFFITVPHEKPNVLCHVITLLLFTLCNIMPLNICTAWIIIQGSESLYLAISLV